METTKDRLAYYERMKENARQQNATHAFAFWCGAIATEKAAQQRMLQTAFGVGMLCLFIGYAAGWLIFAFNFGGW